MSNLGDLLPHVSEGWSFHTVDSELYAVGDGSLLRIGTGGPPCYVEEVLQRVDGVSPLRELLKDADDLDASFVVGVLLRLRQMGIVELLPATGEATDSHFAAFLKRLFPGLEDDELRLLKECRVVVPGTSSLSREIKRHLSEIGIEIDEAKKWLDSAEEIDSRSSIEDWLESSHATDLIVHCDNSINVSKSELNRLLLAKGIAWLPISVGVLELSVGPMIVPGETCCYECYRSRRASNSRNWDQLSKISLVEETTCRSVPRHFPPWVSIASAIASVAIISRLLGKSSPQRSLLGHEWVMSANTLSARLHPVLKVPRCRACGRLGSIPETSPWTVNSNEALDEY